MEKINGKKVARRFTLAPSPTNLLVSIQRYTFSAGPFLPESELSNASYRNCRQEAFEKVCQEVARLPPRRGRRRHNPRVTASDLDGQILKFTKAGTPYSSREIVEGSGALPDQLRSGPVVHRLRALADEKKVKPGKAKGKIGRSG